jgi:hypothetical protein
MLRGVAGGGGGTGDLLSTNNLSEIASPSTARTNLGLGTAAVADTGVASGGNLPTMAQGDTRYGRIFDGSSGLPGAGVGSDGDVVILSDKPQRGSIAIKSAGAWAKGDKTYTWAARPSAASYPGEVITISDFGVDFFSDGTNWIPVGYKLQIRKFSNNSLTGTTSQTTQQTITLPAGLVLAGCLVMPYATWYCTGAAGTRSFRIRDSAATALVSSAAAATVEVIRIQQPIDVVSPAGPHTAVFTNAADPDGFSYAGDTLSLAWNFSASIDILFTMQLGSEADTALLVCSGIEIQYPLA